MKRKRANINNDESKSLNNQRKKFFMNELKRFIEFSDSFKGSILNNDEYIFFKEFLIKYGVSEDSILFREVDYKNEEEIKPETISRLNKIKVMECTKNLIHDIFSGKSIDFAANNKQLLLLEIYHVGQLCSKKFELEDGMEKLKKFNLPMLTNLVLTDGTVKISAELLRNESNYKYALQLFGDDKSYRSLHNVNVIIKILKSRRILVTYNTKVQETDQNEKVDEFKLLIEKFEFVRKVEQKYVINVSKHYNGVSSNDLMKSNNYCIHCNGNCGECSSQNFEGSVDRIILDECILEIYNGLVELGTAAEGYLFLDPQYKNNLDALPDKLKRHLIYWYYSTHFYYVHGKDNRVKLPCCLEDAIYERYNHGEERTFFRLD